MEKKLCVIHTRISHVQSEGDVFVLCIVVTKPVLRVVRWCLREFFDHVGPGKNVEKKKKIQKQQYNATYLHCNRSRKICFLSRSDRVIIVISLRQVSDSLFCSPFSNHCPSFHQVYIHYTPIVLCIILHSINHYRYEFITIRKRFVLFLFIWCL